MFISAFLIGIYSYIIFSLGLLGFLYKEVILGVTIIYLILIIFVLRLFRAGRLPRHERAARSVHYKDLNPLRSLSERRQSSSIAIQKLFQVGVQLPFSRTAVHPLFLTLIIFQTLVNLIGALGPELGFDALWYHLTLPKIYLENHSIFHIEGGLLYYSGMPKLTGMIYLGFLANDTLSKLIHFGFGILSLIALYKLSRIFVDKKFSLLSVLIFYGNLVVGWQSTTAYADLARTFFEIMALWAFVNWWREKKDIWLIEGAFMLGLSISTKLLSVSSILIFSVLLIYYFLRIRSKISKLVRTLVLFIGTALLVPLPYFIFSFINTGNPIYPIFSEFYKIKPNFEFVNPLNLSDPISPLYIIFLPLIFLYFKKFNSIVKIIALYSLFSFIIWYLTPQTGGGRFIMPYLPAYSIILAIIVKMISKYRNFRNFSIALVIFISVISIVYRGAANSKYIPVILGIQSKDQFLTNNLNFSYGDFYDTDGYFKTHIKNSDRVLLFGFHNLYYINFPFIDSSYIKSGDEFNYIATQNTELPERFKFFSLVYINERTGVNLYSLGGQKWIY